MNKFLTEKFNFNSENIFKSERRNLTSISNNQNKTTNQKQFRDRIPLKDITNLFNYTDESFFSTENSQRQKNNADNPYEQAKKKIKKWDQNKIFPGLQSSSLKDKIKFIR
jgi:hypothetical protein